MPKERRILTDEEKKYVREQYKHHCYICGGTLDGYDEGEIQYDHIYAHAAEIAGGEELDKFAPIHASSNPAKRNCHSGKGTKSWVEYKEEIRIKDKLSNISGLKDICKNAKLCSFKRISESEIEFNGKRIPLYNQ